FWGGVVYFYKRKLKLLFVSLTVVFGLVAGGHVGYKDSMFQVAGWVGLLCGESDMYRELG
ncbi:hypothetical protein ACVGW1_05645, partial [Enterobacter intestinihominis]